jgi:NADH-ubiquinone oxidoreductase chain 5
MVVSSFITFILSLYFILLDLVYFLEFGLVIINSSLIEITFLFDWISLLFISFVLFISGIVIFYSRDYILGDLNINRFILLVVMFVFSIMLLIVSPNLIRIMDTTKMKYLQAIGIYIGWFKMNVAKYGN